MGFSPALELPKFKGLQAAIYLVGGGGSGQSTYFNYLTYDIVAKKVVVKKLEARAGSPGGNAEGGGPGYAKTIWYGFTE